MAEINFNAGEVEPAGTFDVKPPGWYKCVVSSSEVKPTKKRDGSFLELEFDIIEGEYAGHKFWDRLNLDNANQKAVQIARKQLAAVCHAVGKPHQIKDSEELHNIPLMVKVKVRPANPEKGWDAMNEVQGYKSVTEAAPSMAPQQQAVAPAPAVQPVQAAPVQPDVPQQGAAPWAVQAGQGGVSAKPPWEK